MNLPPITLEDICIKKTSEKGDATYFFAREKAAETLCNKLTLVMGEGDTSNNGKIWVFDGQIYRDEGRAIIKDLLYRTAKEIIIHMEYQKYSTALHQDCY